MSSSGPTGGATPVERVSGAAIGLVLGGILGSILSVIPAVRSLDPLPWLGGAVLGALYGAWSPPRFVLARAPLPEAVPGQPAPIGSLATVTVRDLQRPTLVAMGIGSVIAVASIPVAWGAYALLGARPSMTVLGLVGVGSLVIAMACMAFVPALLLARDRRAALAAHVWLGAREVTRAFGSRDAARNLPTRPEAIGPWIAANPETDANREAHVELHLMRGDWDAARAAIERMPAASPRDRFARAMADAMLRFHRDADPDVGAARAAADALPPGTDAIEARVALATLEARRRLPDGDWRAPLVEARRLIPESDTAILLRDHGAVLFRMLLRAGWPILALLLVLTLLIGPTVDGGPA
jgi:hypothetical protein